MKHAYMYGQITTRVWKTHILCETAFYAKYAFRYFSIFYFLTIKQRFMKAHILVKFYIFPYLKFCCKHYVLKTQTIRTKLDIYEKGSTTNLVLLGIYP